MVPVVGNSDLSAPGRSHPRRGLVIFPAAARAPKPGSERRSRGTLRRGEWPLLFAALALGVAVIVVAVVALRGGSSASTTALPPPAASVAPAGSTPATRPGSKLTRGHAAVRRASGDGARATGSRTAAGGLVTSAPSSTPPGASVPGATTPNRPANRRSRPADTAGSSTTTTPQGNGLPGVTVPTRTTPLP